uniref:kelch-like protein 10 n=1 Tax=Scatophagus argus TaxID=75038 RepID=UPI001ED82661|nr:kelch-like protein 10 [Scatophagus argus]
MRGEEEGAPTTSGSHRSELEKKMSDMSSAVLTELRRERKLCDVVIKVGDVEFDAHKIILCSCSLYFRTLFTGAWATSKKKIHAIPGVSPEIMQLLINYAYTNSVPVTEGNVVEMLEAADQFMIPGIVQICCFFLEDQLCPTNCIGIWRLVEFYHCPELRSKVFLYILHHFEEIARVSQELMELSVLQLIAIIEDDRLNVKREDTVFEVVLSWINHLLDQRQCHMPVLLPKVRLGLMTIAYLQNSVMNNALIRDCTQCHFILNDALTAFLNFRTYRHSRHVCNNPLARPRLPSAILLVTGGKDGIIASTSLEAYDPRADCWITVATERIWRSHHGAAVLNNSVYLVGGCSHDLYLNTVAKFDIATCTWHQVARMNCWRCYVSVTVHNGCIYAMGGYNGHVYHNTVERYKPDTDQWTMMAPMHARRCGASSTTLNDKVYICGGFNGQRSISTAESYNPNSNQWTMIAPMRFCRSGLGVAAYRGHIYAVGGMNNRTFPLASAEVYNPLTNIWSTVASMYSPRSYFGIEVVDNQLFVVGGYDGATTVSTVEYFDAEAGMWFITVDIKMSRSGLSCCVLHGLYSMAGSLFQRGTLSLSNMEGAA